MIQIIEDDLVTSEIVAALLRRMHYRYCKAHTGADALVQLRTCPIDLVIADMILPDMHGLELLAEKHQLPHMSDIPVLCCTSQTDIETVEAAMGLGAVDFVKKPIELHSFAERVNRAVARAPVRWESWADMSRRLGFVNRSLRPMLILAREVLSDLDTALAGAQPSAAEWAEEMPHGGLSDVPPRMSASGTINELNAVVARARGTAQNVGALRTVQQIDRLWSGRGTTAEIGYMRDALIIELAAFDEAIKTHAAGESTGEGWTAGLEV